MYSAFTLEQREAQGWSGLKPGLLPSELRSKPAAPAPVEHLLDIVETHVAEEADSMTAYRHLAETSADPVVAFVMQLVIEDEERHHELMERIARSMRDSLYWARSAHRLPESPYPLPMAAAGMREAVHDFIRQEHEGVHQMQTLAREMAGLHDGLDSLLLDMMAMDSQKHERMLRFVARRLESAEKAPA